MRAGKPKDLRYPPGILECNRAIARLRKFKELTHHHLHRPQEATLPLARLLPKNTPIDRHQKALVAEINKLIPLVASALHRGRLIPEIAWTEHKKEFDEKFVQKLSKERHDAHLILDYFYLYEHDTVNFRTSLLGMLDQGIGVYEMYRWGAVRRKLNPISWVGFLLSIPVRVLINAGLLSPERDRDTTVLKWVLGLVQAGWVALVAYLIKLVTDHHLLERAWHRMVG